ncbi:GntR family transcriptional regulator [Corticibacter populi]|uniref:GntR family transcriptional regulator n=1 Tax=Corticibacter populi TaxID=1550736 RepID=A0A3M6QV50_9BURK|nr:GntR family transcriptional regulator [Corticibacter populi]RMX06890.1 GntR family transcriptional regulator [Corticibacter populi]
MPKSHATPSSDAAGAQGAADDIYVKIHAAILERRLPPGTKLGEDRLAGIFGVSRARIRQTLARLGYDQVVELFPQRGAFVARPTPEQAMHVFEARRLIEPAVIRRLIQHLSDEHLQSLRAHVAREMDARVRDDQHAVIRLSGEFHTLLAELAGNSALIQSMNRLCTVTVLIIALYDSPTRTTCRADEHGRLIDAIEQHDEERACALMLEHLAHIEKGLVLHRDGTDVDLDAVFAR